MQNLGMYSGFQYYLFMAWLMIFPICNIVFPVKIKKSIFSNCYLKFFLGRDVYTFNLKKYGSEFR